MKVVYSFHCTDKHLDTISDALSDLQRIGEVRSLVSDHWYQIVCTAQPGILVINSVLSANRSSLAV